jgi:hypothetical protein
VGDLPWARNLKFSPSPQGATIILFALGKTHLENLSVPGVKLFALGNHTGFSKVPGVIGPGQANTWDSRPGVVCPGQKKLGKISKSAKVLDKAPQALSSH